MGGARVLEYEVLSELAHGDGADALVRVEDLEVFVLFEDLDEVAFESGADENSVAAPTDVAAVHDFSELGAAGIDEFGEPVGS